MQAEVGLLSPWALAGVLPEVFRNLSRQGITPRRASRSIRHPAIWYVFAGSRGGYSRARIVKALMDRPMNAHQLSEELKLDYTTIQHHLKVLSESGLLHAIGPNYGKAWFLTEKMEQFSDAFAGIVEKLEEKRPSSGGMEDGH